MSMNVGRANNAWIQKQEGSRQTQRNEPIGQASGQPGSQPTYEVVLYHMQYRWHYSIGHSVVQSSRRQEIKTTVSY